MPYIEENRELHGKAKKIEYIIRDSGCWDCISHPKDNFGYRFICRKGLRRSEYMHRYIYMLFNGEIPDKNVIRHKCDNPACINPSHLEIGTQKDNMKDAEKRNRAKIRSGSGNIKAKLTEKQVIEIRELLTKGITPKEIIHKYGISKSTISKIKNNTLWKSIE
ncbi:HNH homing endonuclease [Bacillus phage vB_BceH_LY2]|nr:HNH homing endonuclease [Bacillus phage vB_BceH_LY2]